MLPSGLAWEKVPYLPAFIEKAAVEGLEVPYLHRTVVLVFGGGPAHGPAVPAVDHRKGAAEPVRLQVVGEEQFRAAFP